MATDEQRRPHRFEVRVTVDEFMGAIYTRLCGLPVKYRHREVLSAARAYFEGRVLAPMATDRMIGDAPAFSSGRPGGPTKPDEGIATVQGLNELVDAVPEGMLEGPPLKQ